MYLVLFFDSAREDALSRVEGRYNLGRRAPFVAAWLRGFVAAWLRGCVPRAVACAGVDLSEDFRHTGFFHFLNK